MTARAEVGGRVTRLRERWSRTLLGHALDRSSSLDLGTYTLALSAQLVLCLAPLVIAVSSILRRFRAGSAGGMVSDLLGLSGQSAEAVRQLMEHAGAASWGSLLLGLGYGLFFTTGVAATTQRLLENLWELPRTPWRHWWTRGLWVATLAPLITGVMVFGRMSARVPMSPWQDVATDALVFALLSCLFSWWTQWALLLGAVGWRRLLPGAIATGLGCGLVSVTSTLWVPGEIAEEVVDYGLVGATFVLSLWIFILASVFVVGVTVSKVWDERRRVGGSVDGVVAGEAVKGSHP